VLTVDEMVRVFRSAAIEKGDFSEPGRDHQLHASMRTAVHELRSAGEEGEAAFRGLLSDASLHVRSWVAAELLSRGDAEARRVLEELTRAPGLLGFEASMTLKEHDAGRLESPFK
jgi:hypothetical protein